MEVILPSESAKAIFYKVLGRTRDYVRTATVLQEHYNITIFLIPRCKYTCENETSNVKTWSQYTLNCTTSFKK